MRVSEHYNIGRTQPGLDFLDVPINEDTPLFVDPRALLLLHSTWADDCVAQIQDFFRAVLAAINSGNHTQAKKLLASLREPNETHLGLSRTISRGRALGTLSAATVWGALQKSQAVQSGLLRDLEDTILLIDGIGPDIVSDMTTNLIRKQLINYTEMVCTAHNIPLVKDIASGPLWEPTTGDWTSRYVRLPKTPYGKLLLVPKALVRSKMDYDSGEYYRDFVIPYLREQELQAGSSLVEVLKSGVRRVTKKALANKYGSGKGVCIAETLRHPEILDHYRVAKQTSATGPLTHEELASDTSTALPDWGPLLTAVVSLPSGKKDATTYHRAVEELLTTMFYPALTNPKIEQTINSGRKRIDIAYTNAARSGFFWWLAQHYPSSHVFVECKNYGYDVGNPEVDQLRGRFSPNRGMMGILVCRTVADRSLVTARCRDVAADQAGYIIVLDDADLTSLVTKRSNGTSPTGFGLLKQRFEQLVL